MPEPTTVQEVRLFIAERRHGDGPLRARKDSAGPDFRSADWVRSGARG